MEELWGIIERITFQSQETGFTVARLKSPKSKEIQTIVGTLPSLQAGETISCKGHWKKDPQHGMQFQVEEYQVSLPKDLSGIEKYLGSGLIKGIGPSYAKKIVALFKESTMDILSNQPNRLLKVPGIGEKRLEKICRSWEEQASIREVMIFLQGVGISPSFAQKIYRSFGKNCIERVRSNPYSLARQVFGIGFKTADEIAKKLDFEDTCKERIDAAIEYHLSELSQEGHSCAPTEKLVDLCEKALNVEKAFIKSRIASLVQEDRLVEQPLILEGEPKLFLWLKTLYIAECGIAKELSRILSAPSPIRAIDLDKALAWVQKSLSIELAEEQKQGVAKIFKEKACILTGGPGTGKSTITHAIITLFTHLSPRILLAAPTGRAAKRMSELTGLEAKTLHALLEFDFQKFGFKRNHENPLECDLLIIDEASMIDTSLMYSLLKAVPDHAKLLLIGDIHQLPSVGPGKVLEDLLSSKLLPSTSLKKIFRQASHSKIIVNAHRINNGDFPDTSGGEDSDFFFLKRETPEEILKTILSLVAVRLPRKYHLHPMQDIQVLAPMKKGIIGIDNLNYSLQETLNKQSSYLMRGGKRFSKGDKVMQLRNQHQKEVYNGDIGRIEAIDFVEQEALVSFDGREITYDFSELDELCLAYAASVHKFQGSECPCVIIPVHTTHFKLLQRNLLYTGVTRGKKLVILIGTKKALAICVKNQEVKMRHSGLKEALLSKMAKEIPF